MKLEPLGKFIVVERIALPLTLEEKEADEKPKFDPVGTVVAIGPNVIQIGLEAKVLLTGWDGVEHTIDGVTYTIIDVDYIWAKLIDDAGATKLAIDVTNEVRDSVLGK